MVSQSKVTCLQIIFFGYYRRYTCIWSFEIYWILLRDETEVECVPLVLLKVASELLHQHGSMHGSSHRTAKRTIYWTIPSTSTTAWLWFGVAASRALHCFAWKAAPTSPKPPPLSQFRKLISRFILVIHSQLIHQNSDLYGGFFPLQLP